MCELRSTTAWLCVLNHCSAGWGWTGMWVGTSRRARKERLAKSVWLKVEIQLCCECGSNRVSWHDSPQSEEWPMRTGAQEELNCSRFALLCVLCRARSHFSCACSTLDSYFAVAPCRAKAEKDEQYMDATLLYLNMSDDWTSQMCSMTVETFCNSLKCSFVLFLQQPRQEKNEESKFDWTINTGKMLLLPVIHTWDLESRVTEQLPWDRLHTAGCLFFSCSPVLAQCSPGSTSSMWYKM